MVRLAKNRCEAVNRLTAVNTTHTAYPVLYPCSYRCNSVYEVGGQHTEFVPVAMLP